MNRYWITGGRTEETSGVREVDEIAIGTIGGIHVPRMDLKDHLLIVILSYGLMASLNFFFLDALPNDLIELWRL